ncbi:hypothetical protein HK096_003974 [Nowakowskiella sp. JEL0078]|nr:hypothetical protein HK096_003974 [Nowakowskiella sp. JEL0078]
MILLESANRVIEETLTERFTCVVLTLFSIIYSFKLSFADFDGVTFRLSTPETKSEIILSISIKCYPQLLVYGAEEFLRSEYGERLLDIPEPGFDVSLKFDLNALPDSVEDKCLFLLKLSFFII